MVPHERILQKALAKDVTIRVHSESDYQAAVEASEILFKGNVSDLEKLSEKIFLEIFEGVPQFEIEKHLIEGGIQLIDILSINTSIFTSKGEARKMLQAGGVSLNKEKVQVLETLVDKSLLINDKYILIQKGKKNYFLIKAV